MKKLQYSFGYIKISLAVVFSCFACGIFAQSTYIPIESQSNSLILQVNKGKVPRIVYFGKRFQDKEDYSKIAGQYSQGDDYSGILNAAYTPSGTHNLVEPAITVTHADGNTSLDLHYDSYETRKLDGNVTLTTILLKDPVYPFEVTMFYKVYKNEDVIEQWTEIKHQESGPVVLHKFASANLYLKAESFWLKQFHGDWAKEMQPEESKLTHGIKVLDSKLGTRADLYQPPVFMISLNQPANEDDGKVFYGCIEWSGNFRIDLEVDPLNNLRIIAGMNDFASEYSLDPNKVFTTPAFLFTFSDHGKGDASRKIQRWARNYRIMNGNGERLTLLNNWESTFFDFDEIKLKQLLKDTKNLSVDLFLLDDGWFGNNFPRNNDKAGLGDWQENRQKLPNGISSLVKEAKTNGVKFGIWLEPEMVNPLSDLYKQHPDWIIKQPQRPEHLYRNQLVLDLSNPKVQDFIFNTIDSLFVKNPSLAYIKWDCNAVIYNAYSAHLNKQSHLYIEYVEGLYKVMERVRKKYPDVPMMLCSGGGGRVDYAALKYFTEFWPSDNTDPLERIFIQWEYSYFYPAIATSNHITDWGKQPLKYRADVAMMGKLGFDIAVQKLNETDLKFCQQTVEVYNGIKEIIWHGDQYRLVSPWNNDFASVMYVNEDGSSAVMFNYLVNNRYGSASKSPVILKGLNPDKKYRIQELNLYPGAKPIGGLEAVYSGDFLMTVGLNPRVNSSRTSVVLKIDVIK